jgi:hypothetical protein
MTFRISAPQNQPLCISRHAWDMCVWLTHGRPRTPSDTIGHFRPADPSDRSRPVVWFSPWMMQLVLVCIYCRERLCTIRSARLMSKISPQMVLDETASAASLTSLVRVGYLRTPVQDPATFEAKSDKKLKSRNSDTEVLVQPRV